MFFLKKKLNSTANSIPETNEKHTIYKVGCRFGNNQLEFTLTWCPNTQDPLGALKQKTTSKLQDVRLWERRKHKYVTILFVLSVNYHIFKGFKFDLLVMCVSGKLN